jgi:hypothetical protein
MVAAGLQAPLFITITGLSNDELSPTMYPDGVLVVEVEGLSIAGATNPGDRTIGYICFLRSSSGEIPTDQMRHMYYRKHVYFKLLQDLRLRFDNIPPDCNIPDDCCSVGWMDGDWPQIKAVTSEEIIQLSENHRHTDCNMLLQHHLFNNLAMLGRYSKLNIPCRHEQPRKTNAAFWHEISTNFCSRIRA